MAKTKRCPACRAEVDAEEQHCPNCPHSFFQEEGVQEERKGRSKQPILWLAAGVLFFVAAYKIINFVIKYANADDVKNNPFSVAVQSVSTSTARSPAPGSPEEAAAKERAQEQEAVRLALSHGRVKVVADDGAPLPLPGQPSAAPENTGASPAPAPSGSAPAEEPPVVLTPPGRGTDGSEPPPKEWRLRGHVYDLVTLKPVSHATLVLKDEELNRRFELVTGPDGRYRTIVPPLPDRGYAVAISRPGYAVSYLDPGAEARGKSARERREMAQELTHALDAPYTVRALSQAPVETDFYLAPLQP